MSSWGFITLLKTTDAAAVEKALTDLCVEEGWAPTPVKPRKRSRSDPMQYGTGETSKQWAVAWGAGDKGWMVLRTAPLELLAERSTKHDTFRLARLSKALGCQGLHVSLRDVSLIVLETAADGRWLLSGMPDDDRSSTLGGAEFDESRYEARIEWAKVPAAIHRAIEKYAAGGYDALVRYAAGDPAWNGAAAPLLEGKPVPISGAKTRHFARRKASVEPTSALVVTASCEKHPLAQRVVLDGCVWVTDGGIEAVDAVSGEGFLRKLAAWLGAPIPAGKPGVPIQRFCTFEPPLLSIGDRAQAQLDVRIEQGRASITERDPALRGQIIKQLTPALRGAMANEGAAFPNFERLFTEPTSSATGCFWGESTVVAYWRKKKTALHLDGVEAGELTGIVSCAAATPQWIALVLADPSGSVASQGYGQDTPARVVLIEVAHLPSSRKLDKRATREILTSSKELTFGFTSLSFSNDGRTLIVPAERRKKPVLVAIDLESGERSESKGERPADQAAANAAANFGETPYARFGGSTLRAGAREMVVWGEPLLLLDLESGKKRPLFGPAGLEPVSISPSGRRCIASIKDRCLFVGER